MTRRMIDHEMRLDPPTLDPYSFMDWFRTQLSRIPRKSRKSAQVCLGQNSRGGWDAYDDAVNEFGEYSGYERVYDPVLVIRWKSPEKPKAAMTRCERERARAAERRIAREEEDSEWSIQYQADRLGIKQSEYEQLLSDCQRPDLPDDYFQRNYPTLTALPGKVADEVVGGDA